MRLLPHLRPPGAPAGQPGSPSAGCRDERRIRAAPSAGTAGMSWCCSTRAWCDDRLGIRRIGAAAALLVAEVNEGPTEVVGVLLHAVTQRLDLLLIKEAQDSLLELPGSLSRNDLH